MRTRVIRRTIVLFSLLILALLVSSLISFRTTAQIADGEKWIVHTHTVLDALNQLELSIRNSANQVDEFAATSDPEALTGLRLQLSRAQEELESLQRLTSDNPSQQSY